MRSRNPILVIVLTVLFILSLAACDSWEPGGCGGSDSSSGGSTDDNSGDSSGGSSGDSSGGSSVDDYEGSAQISLNGSSISVDGTGVTVKGTVATITAGGAYTLSGTLNNGQIVVDADSAELVELVLNGVDINNSSSSPIYIAAAEDVNIVLISGTTNSLSDGSSYSFASGEDEPDATLFSKEDLTILGGGALIIDANYNNGIKSKDKLVIEGGKITVDSVDDAIIGKDFVRIEGGTITVDAAGDGLKSTEDEDTEKGYVSIQGGQLNITAGADGIQAETNINISGGSGTIDADAKGLKASVGVTIDGGDFDIDATDDAINTNDSVVINGGAIVLATGDDAIHADYSITFNGGELTIERAYEGIESRNITVNDGTIRLTSSDDGFNATDPDSAGGWDFNPMASSDNCSIAINGGYIVVNANGDGIDSNGSITMTGGVAIVHGPTANNNGPLDHFGFKMTGGLLIAAGSSGMAQAPDTTSTQYSLLLNLTSVQTAGQLIHIESGNGTDILTFAPAKRYQSLAFCSPDLSSGSTYNVYLGGRSSGTVEDGLYSDGTYSGGSLYTTFTVSQKVTQIGSGGMGAPPSRW